MKSKLALFFTGVTLAVSTPISALAGYNPWEHPFFHDERIKSMTQSNGDRACDNLFQRLKAAGRLRGNFDANKVNHVWAHIQNGDCIANAPAPNTGNSQSGETSNPGNSMASEILGAHNKYRQEVGVPPLTWSNELANHAQAWANSLASQGKFEHNNHRDGFNDGENLWAGSGRTFSYTEMVDSWGSEKQYYIIGGVPATVTGENYHKFGHYSQIIWKNTNQVGCATAKGGNNTILVCRYNPPGNFLGQRAY